MLVPAVLQPGQQPSFVTTPIARPTCANTMNGLTQFPCYQVTPGISNIFNTSNRNSTQESTHPLTPKKKSFMKPPISSSFPSHHGILPHMTGVQIASCTSKTNLYIAGLAENVTDKVVRRMVEGIIEPKSCKALLNQYGKCTGTGFIDCLSEEDAEKAKTFLETVYGGCPADKSRQHEQTVKSLEKMNDSTSQQQQNSQTTNKSDDTGVVTCHSSTDSISKTVDLDVGKSSLNQEMNQTKEDSLNYPPWHEVVREGRKLEVKFAFENEKDSLNVYVRNLPRNGFTSQQLKELFVEFGEVTSVKLLETIGGDNLTGAGFVRFSTSEDATLAINTMNSRSVTFSGCEQPLRCKLADRRIRVAPNNHSISSPGELSVTANSATANLANAVSDFPFMYPYSSIPYPTNVISSGAPFTYIAGQTHPQFDTFPLIAPPTIPAPPSHWFRHFPTPSLSSHRMETSMFPTNGAVLLTPELLPTAQPVLFPGPAPNLVPMNSMRVNGHQHLRPVCIPNHVLSGNSNAAPSLLFHSGMQQQQHQQQHQQIQTNVNSQNENKQSTSPYFGYSFQVPSAINAVGFSPPNVNGDQLTMEQLYFSMLQQWKQQLTMQSLFGAHPPWPTGMGQVQSVGDQTAEAIGQAFSHQLASINSSKEFSSQSGHNQLSSIPIDPATLTGATYLIQSLDPCHPSFIGLRPLNQLLQVAPVVTSSSGVMLTSSDTSPPSTNNKTKASSSGQLQHHLKNSSTNQCSLVFPLNLST